MFIISHNKLCLSFYIIHLVYHFISQKAHPINSKNHNWHSVVNIVFNSDIYGHHFHTDSDGCHNNLQDNIFMLTFAMNTNGNWVTQFEKCDCFYDKRILINCEQLCKNRYFDVHNVAMWIWCVKVSFCFLQMGTRSKHGTRVPGYYSGKEDV